MTETSNDLRTLRDQINKAIQALSNLGCATEYWNEQKLDKSSRKAWELGDTVDNPHKLSRIWSISHLAFARSTRLHSRTHWRSYSRLQKKNSRLTYRVYRSVLVLIMQSEPSIVINVLIFYVPQQTLSQRFELKTRNAVWTVSIRNMLGRIIQILTRVDSIINDITRCYHVYFRITYSTLTFFEN